MSTGVPIRSNSVFETLQNILCHEELSTPIIQRKELTLVDFSYLSTTPRVMERYSINQANPDSHSGKLYDPIAVVRQNEDHNLRDDIFPRLSIIGFRYSIEQSFNKRDLIALNRRSLFSKRNTIIALMTWFIWRHQRPPLRLM